MTGYPVNSKLPKITLYDRLDNDEIDPETYHGCYYPDSVYRVTAHILRISFRGGNYVSLIEAIAYRFMPERNIGDKI